MASVLAPRTPYIAGRGLGDQRVFFGREDIFRLVETGRAPFYVEDANAPSVESNGKGWIER